MEGRQKGNVYLCCCLLLGKGVCRQEHPTQTLGLDLNGRNSRSHPGSMRRNLSQGKEEHGSKPRGQGKAWPIKRLLVVDRGWREECVEGMP